MRKLSGLVCMLSIIFSSNLLWGQVDMSRNYSLEQLQTKLIEARKKKSQEDLADIYFLLARYQENVKFNSELALELYIQAKLYYENIGNKSHVNVIKQYIAERYYKSGFLAEAISLYNESSAFYQSTNDSSTVASINFALSKIYDTKGDNEESLKYLTKATSFITGSNHKLQLDLYQGRILNYIRLNELDSALITSNLAFELSDEIDLMRNRAISLFYIGYINFLKEDFNKAEKYLLKSAEIIPTMPYDEDRRKIYKSLSKLYEKIGQFDRGYNYSQAYIALNDSILNHDRITAINNLSIKYQAVEKNKEIEILEIEKESAIQRNAMQRNVLYFVAGGFVLLLVALYYIIRFYTQKIKNETIINDQQHKIDQQKIRELEDTMQINNMQSMIVGQERERERIAKDLHDSLGGLLSTVRLQFDGLKNKLIQPETVVQYDKAASLLDHAVEEVRTISRNLQPGALSKLGLVPAINDLINRFDGEGYPEIFFQHYNLPDKIDGMCALNIYRIVQELLTNTIKYAEAKEVLVQLNYEEGDIYIQFEDDGKGFINEFAEGKGMGLENIESRVKYLKGHMSRDSSPNEGVSYLIKIPY